MKLRRIIAGIFCFSMLMACKKNGDDRGTGYLRVIHGVPDIAGLEVRLNGSVVGIIGSYGLSFPYTAFTEGNLRMQLRRSGSTTDIVDVEIAIVNDAYASFIVCDSLAKLRTAFIQEDALPVQGKAKANIYHLGTIAPAASFTLSGGALVSANRSFNDHLANASLVSYFLMEPGNVTLEARIPGSTGATGVFGSITKDLLPSKTYTYIFRNPVPPSLAPGITFIPN